MRRRLTFTAVFQRLSFVSSTLFLFQTAASRTTQGCRGRASIAEVTYCRDSLMPEGSVRRHAAEQPIPQDQGVKQNGSKMGGEREE